MPIREEYNPAEPIVSPVKPEQIGGRYKVIERLGKGAMGVVYKAHDPVLDRLVAVKKMVDEIGEDEELRRRFHSEARAAAGLNHPNIVTIYELGETSAETFIVMELLEGVDLATVLRRKIPLTVPARLSIVAQLCEGLEFAHHHGIVHRDIKPANLHLSPAGVVKILDFGIARLASSTMTGTGALLGTPDYMSPEQVSGARIDARSDLFAVGAVFYELMCGGRPFEGPTVPSVLLKISVEPHVPARDRAPDVPDHISALIDRLMAKDPGSRPASARAVADEIRAMQGTDAHTLSAAGSEIAAMVTEQTLVPRTPLPLTPRPASVTREAAAIGSADAIVGSRLTPPPPAAGITGRKMRLPYVAGVAAIVLLLAGVAGVLAGVAGWYGLIRKQPAVQTSESTVTASNTAPVPLTSIPPVANPTTSPMTSIPPISSAPISNLPGSNPSASNPSASNPPTSNPSSPDRVVTKAEAPSVVVPAPLPVRRQPTPPPPPTVHRGEVRAAQEAPIPPSDQPPTPRPLDQETLETLTGKRSAQSLDAYDTGPLAMASVARIRDVLDRYARAIERHDSVEVSDLRAGLSPLEQRLLSQGARVDIYELSGVRIVANGLEGRATGIRTVRATLDTGESLTQSSPVTIRLIRRPGGWVIADIR